MGHPPLSPCFVAAEHILGGENTSQTSYRFPDSPTGLLALLSRLGFSDPDLSSGIGALMSCTPVIVAQRFEAQASLVAMRTSGL